MQRRTLIAGTALLPLAFSAAAQDSFPSRPIQMIVPFPPGGVADITGRPTAHVMGKLLKQSVVVQNRPGAGGSVGAAQAARSTPDGYTILMALSSISVLPVADRLQGRTPAYELDQFAPIALISADPTVLVVREDGPYKTLKDFVDAAKARPGTINYGSSGVYGTLHVAMEIFAGAAGIKLFHIPYQGGGPCRSGTSRRPDRRAGVGAVGGDRPDQGRQDAPPRRLGRQAACFAAGRAQHEGAGLRRHLLHLVRPVRADRHTRNPS